MNFKQFLIVYYVALGIITIFFFTAVIFAIGNTAKGADLNTPIMVPATVNGYSTIDLLTYVAKLKASDDAKNTPKPTSDELSVQYLSRYPKPTCPKGVLSSLALQTCQAQVRSYDRDETNWVNVQLAK